MKKYYENKKKTIYIKNDELFRLLNDRHMMLEDKEKYKDLIEVSNELYQKVIKKIRRDRGIKNAMALTCGVAVHKVTGNIEKCVVAVVFDYELENPDDNIWIKAQREEETGKYYIEV